MNYFRKAPASFFLRFLRRALMICDPDRPSLAFGSIRFLRELVGPESIVIEYGAGRSTFWLAKRARQVVSVESDPAWYGFVQSKIKNKETILYKQNSRDYVSSPFRGTQDPHIILVDGKYRKECFAHAWNKIKPGSWVVLDDANREEYRSWLAKYPPPTKCFEDLFGVFCTHFYLKP